LEVQTALPRELYEKIPSNDRDDLDRLHAQILTQWDRDKSPERDGCEDTFEGLPTLAQCSFELAFQFVSEQNLSEGAKALASKYADDGKVRFNYRYYNPKTAIDDEPPPIVVNGTESISPP
ncbi:MAG: hypothetical protein WBG86_04490, partial [Polyangiales bacterium]